MKYLWYSILIILQFALIGGCGKKSNSQGSLRVPTLSTKNDVESSDDAVNAILVCLRQAPEWTLIPKLDGQREEQSLLDAMAFVAKHDLNPIRTALQKYLAEAKLKNGIQDLNAVSKLYVLNRYLFALPKAEDSSRVRFFGGWRGVPVTGELVDLMWPLEKIGPNIRIVGGFRGYNGDFYDALGEFDYFRQMYGRRIVGAL